MRMSRAKIWLPVMVMVLALTAAACGGGGGGDGEGPIPLGGIFDETGATGEVGAPYAAGSRAYIDYLNENGGVDGREVELHDIDYAYEVPAAIDAYNDLVDNRGVEAIIGWGTGDTQAMVEFISEDEIPYISGSLSEELTEIGSHPYNFLAAPTYSDQGRISIQWYLSNWEEDRAPRLAILYHDSPFGRSILEDVNAFAEENGVEVVGEASIQSSDLSATSQLETLGQGEPDFAIVHMTAGPAAVILQDANDMGLDWDFIGLNWTATELTVDAAGAEAAEGFIAVPVAAFPGSGAAGLGTINEFIGERDESLTEDWNVNFVQGWFQTSVMVEGMRRAQQNEGEVTGATIKAGLETMDEWDNEGLAYPVTFTPESHRGVTQVRLYEVQDGQFTAITDLIGLEQ